MSGVALAVEEEALGLALTLSERCWRVVCGPSTTLYQVGGNAPPDGELLVDYRDLQENDAEPE